MSRPATDQMDVASTASSNESAGSNPEKRRASMVFPAPGGPMKRALWPPAAATSSAHFAVCCPRTSARSSAVAGAVSCGAVAGGRPPVPQNVSAASASVRAPYTRIPCTSAPSGAFCSGTIRPSNPRLRASSATGSTPRTANTSPESASSPTTSGVRSGNGVSPAAARIPSAMARSKPTPSLRRSPGARLTVIFFCGSWYPVLRSAVRTRVRASLHAWSGKPTRWNPGSPSARSTCTSTRRAPAPAMAAQ